MTAGQGATPLPWVLTPDTGGKADPADIARKAQENFDALAVQLGTSRASPWVAPTFAATWSDYGTGFMTAAYRKDGTGAVCLRGLVTKSSAPSTNETIFTLPDGWRIAPGQGTFPSGVGPARVDVVTDGRVVWVSGTGNIVSLDAIRFFTA